MGYFGGLSDAGSAAVLVDELSPLTTAIDLVRSYASHWDFFRDWHSS
jgi:hypothetical protein